MAKIIEGTLTPDATLTSSQRVLVRRTKHGTVVGKWPRKRGRAKKPGTVYHEQEFALAAMWASDPDPTMLVAAQQAAKGVTEVARDLLMRASYGTLFDLHAPDGTPMVSYRMVAPNAQYILDQVTDQQGAMLWRSPAGWVALDPGNDGEFLRIFAQAPEWVPTIPPAGATPVAGLFGMLNPAVNSIVGVNSVGGLSAVIPAGTTINALNIYATAASPTTKLAAVVYSRSGNIPSAQLALSPQVTGVTQGVNRIPFTTPLLITTTDLYFLGLNTTVANFNQAGNVTTIHAWSTFSTYPPPNPIGAVTQNYASQVPKVWID